MIGGFFIAEAIRAKQARFAEMTAEQQHWSLLAEEIDHFHDSDQIISEKPRSKDDIAREIITKKCGPKMADTLLVEPESRAYLGLPALS